MVAMALAMVEIRATPSRGRGVFARAAIASGTVIMRARPYALVPDDAHMLAHCAACLAQVDESAWACEDCGCAVLCSACRQVAFAQRTHAAECATLSRLRLGGAIGEPGSTSGSLRLFLRLLLARADRGAAMTRRVRVAAHVLD